MPSGKWFQRKRSFKNWPKNTKLQWHPPLRQSCKGFTQETSTQNFPNQI